MPAYYLYINDQVHGPYSEGEVKSRVDAGNLQPDTQVCADGGEWGRLANAFPSLYYAPPRPDSSALGSAVSETSQIDPSKRPVALEQSQTFEGIGRGVFFQYFIVFGVIVGGAISLGAAQPSIDGSKLMFVPAVLMLIPVALRLKNIGINSAWCLLLFLPPLSVLVTIPCFLLPTGYQEHRKLDLTAKILGGGFLILLFAFLIAVLFFV